MGRARDRAGNIWETDANGHAIRLIQPAQTAGLPGGAIVAIPPDPALAAQKQREQARQDAADARAREASTRADRADARAAQAAAREQKKFESEDTMAPPPGDANLTGDDYLKTIPPALAGQVKALAEGRRAFPTGSALRSPAVQQLIAAATQYDPTLDAANAATRVATRKKFTSGTTRDNITAINTALGHLGSLWEDAKKLNNFSSPLINAPVNAVESGALGDARYNNFNLTRHAVVDELEKAFRGSGGTQAGIDEWKSGINNAQSPDQLRGAVGKAVTLLDSRLQALSDAYAQGMGRSSDPMTFLNPHAAAVFNALGPNGDGNVPALPKDFGGSPPILGGDDGAPPNAPPSPAGPPTIKPADFSGQAGGPDQSLAGVDPNKGALGQTYRNAYDPVGAAALSTFIKKGAPYETAAAYATSHGFNPPDPKDYAAAVSFAAAHDGATNVEASRAVPTTLGERLAASPAATALVGFNSGATAGLSDSVGRTLAGPGWDANRAAMSATNPISDVVGNAAGGATAMFGGEAALSKFAPGALALGSRVLGRFAPAAGDAAYGALYGANENPDDPAQGAGLGALIGAGGGYAGRKLAGGLANVIAPPEGAFGPVYAQGSFPTVGQRFSKSGWVGRSLNTAEQAMQSFPGLGAMVARARDIPRDAAQLGAFNEALGELAPFDPVLGKTVSRLPNGTQPGTQPHVFAKQAFDAAYDTARAGMQFVPNKDFADETQAFAAKWQPLLNGEQQQQLQSLIKSAVSTRLKAGGGALAGDAYKLASSDIGQAASTWSKGEPTLAEAASEYQGLLDNAAKRTSDPKAAQLLDAADRGYAKYAVVRNAGARVGGDPGTFTMKNLLRATQQEGGGVKSGPFQRGTALMQDYATAVQPLGDTLSNSGTGERLMTNRMFMGEQAGVGAVGLGSGLGGAALAHPGALAPFAAYAPGANALLTRLIAPRSATLPAPVAQVLEQIAAGIRDRSALGGRLVLPGALALETGQ